MERSACFSQNLRVRFRETNEGLYHQTVVCLLESSRHLARCFDVYAAVAVVDQASNFILLQVKLNFGVS